MIFFVFSYNRPEHLLNCVRSIEVCSPASDIVIFDDHSDDPKAKEVLDLISQKHDVRKTSSPQPDKRHGGLYANMQDALHLAEYDSLICFLQDDTQLVRTITEDDKNFINEYFDHNPKAGFFAPVFQRGNSRPEVLENFEMVESERLYFFFKNPKKKIAGEYYSDISVTRKSRLALVDWTFSDDEYENELKARQHFQRMAYPCNPFAMWLPNPPAYRNKVKTFSFALAERLNSAGLYPYQIMNSKDQERLKKHKDSVPPIAEQYLDTVSGEPSKPWVYEPLMQRKWLKKFDKLEKKLLG